MFRNLLPSIWKRQGDPARGDEQAPDLFESFFRAPFGVFDVERMPAVDVSDNDDEVVVSAELPGVDPKDVELTLERDVLRIRGEKKYAREEKTDNSLRRERGYGSFSRSIPLPCAVKTDKITADFKNGVLRVTLPKDEAAKPQRITVRA